MFHEDDATRHAGRHCRRADYDARSAPRCERSRRRGNDCARRSPRRAAAKPNRERAMPSELDAASSEFVDALVDVLVANRSGSASADQRSRLAKARAKAEELMTTKQYGDAVFKAFGRLEAGISKPPR